MLAFVGIPGRGRPRRKGVDEVMMKVERRERDELACEVEHQSPVPSWIPIQLGYGCSVCLWEFEASDQVMAFTFVNLIRPGMGE